MKKVLVLGINGFTGKYFQKYIESNKLTKKYLFIGIDKKIDKNCNIKCIKADLLTYNVLENTITKEKPDYIVNFAGILKSDDPLKAIEINANIALRIFDTVVKNKLKVKKILLIGSAAEYGTPKYLPIDEKHELNPLNFYGFSKVIQTEYAKHYHQNFRLNINIARTFNLIGEGMPEVMAIGSFINQINHAKDGDKIHVGNLNTKRDYVKIYDAVDAYWKILLNGNSGEIYNVCSGKSIRIGNILKHLINKSKKQLKIVFDKNKHYKNDVKVIYGNNSKIIKKLKWSQKNEY